MNRKSLALGMIVPLAAAGAVATAPVASANPNHPNVTREGVCDRPAVDRLTLKAQTVANDHHMIKLTLKFSTSRQRANNRDWTAVIRRISPQPRLIVRDFDVEDEFTGTGPRRSYELIATVPNKPRKDQFRARVFNDRGQECVVTLPFRQVDN